MNCIVTRRVKSSNICTVASARGLLSVLLVTTLTSCAFHPTGLGGEATSDDAAVPEVDAGGASRDAEETSAQPSEASVDEGSAEDAKSLERDAGDDDARVDAPPALVARLNLGGADLDGVDFPGHWIASPVPGACGPDRFENAPLHGTNDPGLFAAEVFGNPLKCSFGGSALSPGTYRVRLYFAELYWGPGCPGGGNGTGARVFSIALEGKTVLTDFDLFAASGGCMASKTVSTGSPVVQSFDVVVKDGTLDLVGTASKDNAKLSAIEIFGPM
jgi:hypothetical protein